MNLCNCNVHLQTFIEAQKSLFCNEILNLDGKNWGKASSFLTAFSCNKKRDGKNGFAT